MWWMVERLMQRHVMHEGLFQSHPAEVVVVAVEVE